MAAPVMLEVREQRGPFGVFVKWVFWIFQGAMLLVTLGTCSLVGNFVSAPNPEVALGAGLFGTLALGVIWIVWPIGTLGFGLMVLLTRGRKRLIPRRRPRRPACRGPARPPDHRGIRQVPDLTR
ncbi:hypothetical protein ACE7GA_21670 [Roseomonas sp. CCTCC AB2023176]|uniref:hypothetical protein n=1 Tax=Roseomonas sp. CCTCC AB2023176 TaxID=3342640 RepID=UPI0035D77043